MFIRFLNLFVAGFVGLLVGGIGGALWFGASTGAAVATLVGLFGGVAIPVVWPKIKQWVHPFICPNCGSRDSEFQTREIRCRDVPKPVHRSDLIHYAATSDLSLKTKRVDQLLLKRTTYEELRKCNHCGQVQHLKTYTADTEINFRWVST